MKKYTTLNKKKNVKEFKRFVIPVEYLMETIKLLQHCLKFNIHKNTKVQELVKKDKHVLIPMYFVNAALMFVVSWKYKIKTFFNCRYLNPKRQFLPLDMPIFSFQFIETLLYLF